MISLGVKKNEWVCIGRYSGSRFKIDGGEVRIINDDEVIATLLDPDDIKKPCRGYHGRRKT